MSDAVLPFVLIIAEFDAGSQKEDKGSFLFSANPDSNQVLIGKSLYRICVECIFMWGKYFLVENN